MKWLTILLTLSLTGCYITPGLPPGDPASGEVARLSFRDARLASCVQRVGATYVNQIVRLDCQSQGIRSLDGITQLGYLRALDVSDNPIGWLNLYGLSLNQLAVRNTNISYLDVSHLPLSVLDVSNNQLGSLNNLPETLSYLIGDHNQLSQLNLSHLESLRWLSLSDNQLHSLDLPYSGLQGLNLARNQLHTLSIPNTVTDLDLSYNQFSQFGHINSASKTLASLTLDGNRSDYLDTRALVSLEQLSVENMGLVSLNLASNRQLERLDADTNHLDALWIDNNHVLEAVSANNNDLTDRFDFNDHQRLAQLNLVNNNIATIRLDRSPALQTVDLRGNPLSGKTIEHLNGLDLKFYY